MGYQTDMQRAEELGQKRAALLLLSQDLEGLEQALADTELSPSAKRYIGFMRSTLTSANKYPLPRSMPPKPLSPGFYQRTKPALGGDTPEDTKHDHPRSLGPWEPYHLHVHASRVD